LEQAGASQEGVSGEAGGAVAGRGTAQTAAETGRAAPRTEVVGAGACAAAGAAAAEIAVGTAGSAAAPPAV
jgi:hypothetical protein